MNWLAIVFVGWRERERGLSHNSSLPTPGTPAETYTATVTATSGSLSHTTTMTIVVQ